MLAPGDLRAYVVERVPAAQIVRAPAPPMTVTIAAFGEADTWIDQTIAWWGDKLRKLHTAIYQGAVSVSTGLEVPQESASPEAARAYLVRTFLHLAGINGWPPPQAGARVAAMQAQPVAQGVVATVQRLAEFGPDPRWTGAASWYKIANQVAQGAALASAGEAAGIVSIKARSVARDVSERLDKAAAQWGALAQQYGQNMSRSAGSIGTGIGLALGVGILAALGYAVRSVR